MTVQRIEQRNWGSFLATFSETLVGKSAEIEVASLELGDQLMAEWSPHLGMSYDPKDDLIMVMVDGLDHMISSPRELCVDADVGRMIGLEIIDGENRRQILKFKDPLTLPSPAG
jgi:hypothetical protein